MNIDPLSSPAVEGTRMKHAGDASRLTRPLPPSAMKQSPSPAPATAYAASQIRSSLERLNRISEQFITTCASEEGELSRVAVRMEEIASIMRPHVLGKGTSLSRIDSIQHEQAIEAPDRASSMRRSASTSSLGENRSNRSSSFSKHDADMLGLGQAVSVKKARVQNALFADATAISYDIESPRPTFHQTQPLIDRRRVLARGRTELLSRFSKSMRAIVPLNTDKTKNVDGDTDELRLNALNIFEKIDCSGDGYLQKHEVLQAIIAVKESTEDSGITDPELFMETVMVEVDKDGDGRLDFEEFLEMIKKGLIPTGSGDKNQNFPRQLMKMGKKVFQSHKVNVQDKVVGHDRYVIHPKWKGHVGWDILVSILILVIIFTLPLSFGWEDFGNVLLNVNLFKVNLAIDIVFILDLIKSFFTGIVDENDAIIMKRKDIVRTYLKGYFIFDLLSSVPLDLIFYLTGLMSGAARHSLKLLKLFRIAKLFRLRRVSQLFNLVGAFSVHLEETLNFHVTADIVKVAQILFLALVMAHWIGCFQFMLVRSNDFPPDSWVVFSDLQDAIPVVQWSWSVYKALAQMILIGFQTPPFTNTSCETNSRWCQIEHWVTLGCLYIGAIFYSYLISSMLSIFSSGYHSRKVFEDKLDALDGYMKSERLPASIRERVKKQFRYQHANRKFYNKEEVLQAITPSHLREIREFKAMQLTEKVPMLADPENKAFAQALAPHLEQKVFYEGDVIFEERTTADAMYFISSGVIELYVPSSYRNDNYHVIGDGCFFGEVSLLQGIKRTTSAKAQTQCVLFRVGKNELLSVLRDFPSAAKLLKNVASSRRRRVLHWIRPDQFDLSKGDEGDSEDCRTELYKETRRQRTDLVDDE